MRTATNLAEALTRSGGHEIAIPLATESLEIRQQILSSEHPDTLESAYILGIAFSLTDPERAGILLAETHKMQIRVLGENHPDTERTAEALQRVSG